MRQYRPQALVLNAGHTPVMAPLHKQDWKTFSECWNVDTRQVFDWAVAALTLPLERGSTVVTMSSLAALRGSPLSGGYAAAKAGARFVSNYAGAVSDQEHLGIRFVALLPQLTPATELGSIAVRAYAERQGVDVATFTSNLEPLLTPDRVGAVVVDLIATDASGDRPSGTAYRLTGIEFVALDD